MPPQAYWQLLRGDHAGIDAGVQVGHGARSRPGRQRRSPERQAPCSLVHTWKNRVPMPAKNRGGLDVQGQTVAAGPGWGPARWRRTWRTCAGGPASASWGCPASARRGWVRLDSWIKLPFSTFSDTQKKDNHTGDCPPRGTEERPPNPIQRPVQHGHGPLLPSISEQSYQKSGRHASLIAEFRLFFRNHRRRARVGEQVGGCVD